MDRALRTNGQLYYTGGKYTLDILFETPKLTLLQGELEHRHVKQFYARTNKVAYEMQIACKQRKRALLRNIRETDTFVPLSEMRRRKKDTKRACAEARARARPDSLELSAPLDRYSISKSQRAAIVLPRWLNEHSQDPATKVSPHHRGSRAQTVWYHICGTIPSGHESRGDEG